MIGRIGQELKYDIKSLGFNFWLPPLISLVFVIITYPVAAVCLQNGWPNEHTLPLLEMYLPVMGALWGIFSLQDMLEETGGEIYFSYRRTRLYWGVWRQLRFFLFYAALAALVCLAVGPMIGQSLLPHQYLLYLCQGFFLMGLGFLGMAFFGKAGDALILVALYVCAHILFGQDGATWSQHTTIYLGNLNMTATTWLEITPLMIRAAALGAVCFIAGHIRLRYR